MAVAVVFTFFRHFFPSQTPRRLSRLFHFTFPCVCDAGLSVVACVCTGMLSLCSQAWWKVLPDRAYTRVMGALVSLVAGKVCTPVLGAKDLGEEQTYALHRIFKTLEEAVSCVNLRTFRAKLRSCFGEQTALISSKSSPVRNCGTKKGERQACTRWTDQICSFSRSTADL